MNPQELKKLAAKISKTLQSKLEPDSTVIAGISGGPDSIFILNMLAEIAPQLNLKVIVAHLNHQLRKEADQESEFLQAQLTQLPSDYFQGSFKKVEIAQKSKEEKKGLEESGRQTRYQFFQELAQKHQAHCVLTAHHADDNLETILHNFIRGAGLNGLSGMEQFAPHPLLKDTPLFRPLLTISKAEILSYLEKNTIPYQIDASNFSDQFTRNALRLHIIPALKKFNPNLTQTINQNALELKKIAHFLNKETEKKLQSLLLSNNLEQLPVTLDAKKFRQLHPALQNQLLRIIHQKLLHHQQNLSHTHARAILKMINKNIGNKQKAYGKLIFTLRNNEIKITLDKP